ncbi:MAG: sulfotransferase domain-containing protein [Candidatus Hodarchaeota archaeon]
MLIICCGMPRAGSTLQYNIARTLIEEIDLGTGLGYFTDLYKHQIFEWAKADEFYVIKIHNVPSLSITELAVEGELKICYIYRDIRDVALSLKQKWSLKGQRLLKWLDQIIKIYYDLEKISGVLWQKYEEVMPDMNHAIRQIAEFFQLEITEEIVSFVVEECSLTNVKEIMCTLNRGLKRKLRTRWKRAMVKIGSVQIEPVSSPLIDKRTLVHHDHISKTNGAIGAWQQFLDKKDVEVITNRYKTWLLETGYNLD